MKLSLVLISVFLFILPGSGQDSVYVKRKLSSTDINLLYSMYTQDGNHSAVTGGTGTEDLQVYAPHVQFGQDWDSLNTLYVKAGFDFITSASTDNIDYVKSSASYKDINTQLSLGYGHYFRKTRLEAGLGGYFSIESDYLSRGANMWVYYSDKPAMNSISFSFHAFFDDLRWGRLNPDYRKPVTLIYPVELRDTSWFDIYMRYSYNFDVGYERVINKRLSFGIYPGLVIQKGLLSTPYHRVYFQEQEDAKVENLPRSRVRVPLGFKLNAYVGSGLIINSFYRFYWDDFDVVANTAELSAFYKVTPFWTPSLTFRYHSQSAAAYFLPYKEHSLSELYYTSDYDLSGFYSFEAGIGIRYAPFSRLAGNWLFHEVYLKYSYYWRSDGLRAHYISSFFGFGQNRK